MKRRVAAAVLLLVWACSEAPPTDAATPATPRVAPGPDIEAALSALPSSPTQSTVCARYGRERTVLLTRLRSAPRDSALAASARTLVTKITDACN
jgi:hypothetical protein